MSLPKEKGVKWSLKEQKLLLVICLEYHKQNGVDTHFSWPEIAENFSKRGTRTVSAKDAKNKFDYMKSIWRAWTDLRFNETGAGWNPNTQTVETTDEWWVMKLAEGDRYRKFRKKPVDPELSELWDSVYNSICAKGQYARTAGKDKPEPQVAEVPHEADRNNPEFYIATEDDLENEELGDLGDPTPCQDTSPPVPKGPGPSGSTQSQAKRKKKQNSAAALYSQTMASIDSSNDKFLSLLQPEPVVPVEGSGSSSKKNVEYELEEAIEVINRFVEEGAMKVAEGLWSYAVDELNNDASRRLFMTLKTNAEKKIWLEYKFKKHG